MTVFSISSILVKALSKISHNTSDGIDEELENVDKCIDSARNILFNLLGNVFSYRCKLLSQSAQLHVWSLYMNLFLRSGLLLLQSDNQLPRLFPAVTKTFSEVSTS